MSLKTVVPYCLCILLVPTIALAQERIEDFVRNIPPGKSVSITLSPMYPSRDIPSVVGVADLGVEGEIMSRVSSQAAGPHYVSTRYTVRVENVLFNRASLPKTPTSAISTVSFTREGGKISFEGREINAVDSTLPPFEVGDHLLLLLKRDRGDGDLVIVGGPYGVFSEQQGSIKSFLRVDTQMKNKYEGLDVATFRGLVSRAAAVPR